MTTATITPVQLATWCADRIPLRFGRHRHLWVIEAVTGTTVTLACQGNVSHRITGLHVTDDLREA